MIKSSQLVTRGQIMNALEQMYPSLTLFSDLNWESVSKEYESDYLDIPFPEYLQQKFIDGDCPAYLFELAYFELAQFDVKSSKESFPTNKGIYLNPTCLFLSLEFDVKKMIDEANQGQINIFERSNILGLFKDYNGSLRMSELTEDDLKILQLLEDGPKFSLGFVEESQRNALQKLIDSGLILNLLS